MKASEQEALDYLLVNGQRIEMDPQTGVLERKLYHLDRIMFGTNTILLFKYPLLKRKLNAIKQEIRETKQDYYTEEEIVQKALEILSTQDLI